jgi:hypothetical protein
MSQEACLKAGMSRMVAVMEMSILLTNTQRAALSGPNKDAADAQRAIFPALARAAIGP